MDLTETVRTYYARVDAGDTEGVLALFSDDVRYERQGTPSITGKDELRRFYTDGRIIAEGRHELEFVAASGDWVAVRGTFTGRLRDGEQVELVFTDWHHFASGLIDHRQSLFPGRAV